MKMSMNTYHADLDTAETRLYGAIMELSTRLMMCQDLAQRERLREHIWVLREQLVGLVQEMPIYSDSELELMEKQRMAGYGPGMVLAPIPRNAT